uniref:cGMP-dependent protein kinase n=1 Tax=Scophthalmus maximus TaxID=52904 RepID=A0A8D3DXL0_SCOMX
MKNKERDCHLFSFHEAQSDNSDKQNSQHQPTAYYSPMTRRKVLKQALHYNPFKKKVRSKMSNSPSSFADSVKKLLTDALNKNQYLRRLELQQVKDMVECMYERTYQQGEYVVTQGEAGNHLFVLAEGKLDVFQHNKLLTSITVWTTFGELAILYNCTRTASVRAVNKVRTWALDREVFQNVMRRTAETRHEQYRNFLRRSAPRYAPATYYDKGDFVIREGEEGSTFYILAQGKVTRPFSNVTLRGSQSTVDDISYVTFALKVIKKKHVVDNRQEEHIHSERKILAEARSPFVVKLYRTFRDDKYVYMLLEACLGGEIWSLLRDRGSFDDATARFCVGCVTEAFDYLHRKGVLYRDLKPENLMLDTEGYIKLVDFGFAKKIRCGQKTWTFCGTPEYVAPEIILNKGHNFSVDFWSLGILVFELLTGSPPFSGSDQMMTYTFILKGIEKMDFPKKITKRPEDLIRKLCRRNPSERLGNLKNGITDIKKHRWFNGFNWEGLKARTLVSPLKRNVTGPTDHGYFDSYPPDEDNPPDELSGWDMDF